MKVKRRNFLEHISGWTMGGLLGLVGSTIQVQAFSEIRRKCDNKAASDLEKLKMILKGKDPNIWLFTGDSITHGAKHTHGHRSYPEVFQERIRWEISRVRDVVINTGISGHAASNILSDFEWRVAQFKPGVVSVMIGTNDCAREGMTPELYRQHLSELIQRIREIDAIPILHTPNIIILDASPERRTLPKYILVLRDLAAQENVVLVDNYGHWEATGSERTMEYVFRTWLNDPLHPNQFGHQEIARLMFQVLDIFDPNAATCGGPYFEGKH